MRFSEVASLCETLEETSSRKAMVGLVANFLRSSEEGDVEPVVRIILGSPIPAWRDYVRKREEFIPFPVMNVTVSCLLD